MEVNTMSVQYLLIYIAIFVSVGLVVGTIAKMYLYGIRGSMLLLSPLYVVITFIVIPLVMTLILAAYPEFYAVFLYIAIGLRHSL
jgi:hypothetical protein